jgi:hypothetical protein
LYRAPFGLLREDGEILARPRAKVAFQQTPSDLGSKTKGLRDRCGRFARSFKG